MLAEEQDRIYIPGELDPLLQGNPATRSPNARRLTVLIVLCILERCTYYLSMTQSVDVRNNGEGSYEYCGVLNDNLTVLGLNESWNDQLVRSTAYLLPVVGGALADCWFGCVPVLRCCGLLYVIGTCLLTLIIYVPVTAGPSPLCIRELKYIYETIMALAAGFIRPCLLALAYEAGIPLMGPIALNQLHYLGEAIGQTIGSAVSFGATYGKTPLMGLSLVTALLILLLSGCAKLPERRGWQPDQFYLLGWHRMRRLALVFLPVIVATIGNVFHCFTLDARGVAYFHANLTSAPAAATGAGQLSQRLFLRDSNLMLLTYSVAMLVSMLALALLTWKVPATQSLTVRICIGLAMAVVNQAIGFCIYKLFPQLASADALRLEHVYLGFGSLSCMLAASEAFMFSTMNELALLMAPAEIRAYTAGLIYSLWGTGFVFSLFIQWVSYDRIAGNSANRYFLDVIQWVCVAFGCAAVASIAHFIPLASRALTWLIDIEANSRLRERAAVMAGQ